VVVEVLADFYKQTANFWTSIAVCARCYAFSWLVC